MSQDNTVCILDSSIVNPFRTLKVHHPLLKSKMQELEKNIRALVYKHNCQISFCLVSNNYFNPFTFNFEPGYNRIFTFNCLQLSSNRRLIVDYDISKFYNVSCFLNDYYSYKAYLMSEIDYALWHLYSTDLNDVRFYFNEENNPSEDLTFSINDYCYEVDSSPAFINQDESPSLMDLL